MHSYLVWHLLWLDKSATLSVLADCLGLIVQAHFAACFIYTSPLLSDHDPVPAVCCTGLVDAIGVACSACTAPLLQVCQQEQEQHSSNASTADASASMQVVKLSAAMLELWRTLFLLWTDVTGQPVLSSAFKSTLLPATELAAAMLSTFRTPGYFISASTECHSFNNEASSRSTCHEYDCTAVLMAADALLGLAAVDILQLNL